MDEWRRLRDSIHREVCEKGFDKSLNSFVESYGSKLFDASVLLLSGVGFLPPTDRENPRYDRSDRANT